jgi:hypothetical protein
VPLTIGEGVRTGSELVVSQRAAGANMSIDVSAGSAVINDDHADGGGVYAYTLGAATNVAVTGSDPTNPRIDRVVIRVRDQGLGDAANDQGPVVVAGTPTSGATLANLNGAAAVPGSSVLLANILVPAASSSVTKAGHAQGSTTERYLHAQKTSFPEAAELAEARLFNGAGTKSGTNRLPGLDSNQQPSG